MKSPRLRAAEEDRKNVEQLLRLAWSDLSDDFDIVLVNNNPHMTPEGPIQLESFRVIPPQPVLPIERKPSETARYYEFVGYRRRVGNHDYVYLLVERIDMKDVYLKLYINVEGQPPDLPPSNPLLNRDL